MGLLEEARAEAVKVGAGPRCTVAKIRDAMTSKDQRELDEAIADNDIPGTVLSRVLKGRGYNIGPTPIQRHRKGECACPRG